MSTLKTNRIENLTTTDGGISIDNSGRVGLGTTAPGTVAHADADNLVVSDSGDCGITINSGTSSTGKLIFNDSDGTKRGGISYDHSTEQTHIYSNGDGDGIYLDSSGRLLVGTTTEGEPNADNLTIADSGNCGLTLRSGSSNVGAIYFSDATSGNGEFDGYIDYNQSTSLMRFGTASTSRVVIDSSGRVGVGVTSPGSLYPGAYDLVIGDGTGDRGMTIYAGTSNLSSIYFADGTSGDARYRGIVDYTHTSDWMRFYTSGAERMRINQAGHVYASNTGSFYGDSGTTKFHSFDQGASQWTFGVRSSNTTPYGMVISYSAATPNNTSSQFLYCVDNTAVRATIYSNGGLVNYQSNNGNLCDEREKKNIALVSSKWDAVKQWNIKEFHYNEEADSDDKRLGVIAQEVEQTSPGLIIDWTKQRAEDAVLDDDGNVVTPAKEEILRKGVKEQQMMWMAIKALQEAQDRIETLEAEVAALKSN